MEALVSLVVLVIAVYLGLKIIKNVVVTAVLVLILLAVLWYAGYLTI